MNAEIDSRDPQRRIVMGGNNMSVTREAKIGLDGVGPLLPGELNRGERVLRRIPRGAAMSDDFQRMVHFVGQAFS